VVCLQICKLLMDSRRCERCALLKQSLFKSDIRDVFLAHLVHLVHLVTGGRFANVQVVDG